MATAAVIRRKLREIQQRVMFLSTLYTYSDGLKLPPRNTRRSFSFSAGPTSIGIELAIDVTCSGVSCISRATTSTSSALANVRVRGVFFFFF